MTESIWRKNITMETIAGSVRSFWSWYLAQAQGLRLDWMLDRGERRLLVRIQGDDAAVLSVLDGAGAPSDANGKLVVRKLLGKSGPALQSTFSSGAGVDDCACAIQAVALRASKA